MNEPRDRWAVLTQVGPHRWVLECVTAGGASLLQPRWWDTGWGRDSGPRTVSSVPLGWGCRSGAIHWARSHGLRVFSYRNGYHEL